MIINNKRVHPDHIKFLIEAVVHYIEDAEHTEVGARMRRDKALQTFLRDTKLETIRSTFYLETMEMRCPKCDVLLNNEDPHLICFECGQTIDFISEAAKAFCKETCTDTSMLNCENHAKLLQRKKENIC